MMAACSFITSCQNTGRQDIENLVNDSIGVADNTLTYEGVIPAADGPHIRYTLTITDECIRHFNLTTTYHKAENSKDVAFEHKGIIENLSKTVGGGVKHAIKLALGQNESIYMM